MFSLLNSSQKTLESLIIHGSMREDYGTYDYLSQSLASDDLPVLPKLKRLKFCPRDFPRLFFFLFLFLLPLADLTDFMAAIQPFSRELTGKNYSQQIVWKS